MGKIEKLISAVKREAEIEAERREYEELQQALDRMSVYQLYQLVELWEQAEGDPAEDDRVKAIFASVGGLHLLESG
ncbi:hypothetical protein AABM06_03445 [Listeria ivanovii]|uniref:hypothetical protein n=1 Tax=Listeria ivanovii TaxID=1638 RepID=UPI0016234F7C|nr:hypothetical protein [Listeria ivanovii]MBC1758727.1 hypothetical protein [Listeria ivanovii]